MHYSDTAIKCGKSLRDCRIKKRLSQTELAIKLEIATQFISAFERGDKYPWKDARIKINIFFNKIIYEVKISDTRARINKTIVKQRRRV